MDAKLLAFFSLLLVFNGLGFLFGFVFKSWRISRNKGNLEEKLSAMKVEAQNEVAQLQERANTEAQQLRSEARREVEEQRQELQNKEKRIQDKEQLLDERQKTIDTTEQKQQIQRDKFDEKKSALETLEEEYKNTLSSLAEMSREDARKQLMQEVEKKSQDALFSRTIKLEQENNTAIESQAKDLLVTAIQRYGNAVDNDIMSTYVNIGDDELKGKIIGKEGRNIKAFEKYSGVQLLIDETPGQIVISSFDPIRRAVAKKALDNLVLDGRIQPARIEELIEEAKHAVNDIIASKGKQAAAECGVNNLHPELIDILGRLYFRYSFGQNVLQHSIEMAHIAKVIALELGANVEVAQAGALLHDIGKAVDHEIEGTHVEIGRRMLQKYGVDEEVILAMQAHHEEYPYETLESRIVQTVDAISSTRPGARSDNAQMYVQKLEGLERIARTIEGVQDAYAVSAGREMRIFVDPSTVNDFQAGKIAKKVAKQVEAELKYPGEIKVIVIREKRTIEFAR